MEEKRKIIKTIKPIHVLPIGFLVVILIGTFLLTLPISTHDGGLSFLDAFFTATSATCVTGLIVVDTGTTFTTFGQVVVITMIQLGGLGFMTVVTLLFIAVGKKVSLKERMTIAESLGENKLQGMLTLVKNVVKVTFIIEFIGAILLSVRFIPLYGPRGIWYAIFHSISAFCNAGFDLIGNYQSLVPFVKDPAVSLTICALVISGGLGFGVIMDLWHNRSYKKLRIHSRLVLWMTGLFLIIPAIMFLLFEFNNTTMTDLTFTEKIMAAFFQSVTCRTAGFNTIDQIALTDASKLLSIIIMFIGAAPAGTAGGIKVTTIAVLLLSVRALTHNKPDTEIMKRSISQATIRKAVSIFFIGLSTLLVFTLTVVAIEGNKIPFIDQLYELTSAIATVGLSAGLTAVSTNITRLMICCLMFMGRVGILTIALVMGDNSNKPIIKYPEADIMVG